MAATRSTHSFNIYTYLLLTLSSTTIALPFQAPSTSSAQSLPRFLSISSISSEVHALSKRSNSAATAIGPLIGAVVLCFGLYVLYQWLRKRKDKNYFIRKEGQPTRHGTPSTPSTTTQGGNIERKRSDKSDSGNSTRSEKSMSKAVSSSGVLEVMIKEEEEGNQPLPPTYSERRDSRTTRRGSVSTSKNASQPASRETSQDRSSVVTDGGESIGSVKLSQGPQRTVEVKKPEPVRHKAAGVRGSEYWSKNTSASQLAPE